MKLFLNRILAFLYDVIIQLILLLLLIISVNFLNERVPLANWQRQLILWSVSLLLFILLYAVLPIRMKGSFGKFLTGLQVIPTNGRMTFGRWLFREIVLKYLYPYTGVIVYFYVANHINHRVFWLSIGLGIYIGIGLLVQLLFILIKRKPLHDVLLRTTVVFRNKNE